MSDVRVRKNRNPQFNPELIFGRTMIQVDYRRDCEAMGTRFEVFLSGQDREHLEAVAVAVCEEVIRLDNVLSRFNPGSEIARINREAGGQSVRVDREVFALLERCEQARELTHGYFDITAASGGNGIELDAEHCTVRFKRSGVVIDLGAIGKGYALDYGREILLRFGVDSGLLNGGTSSILAMGGPFAVDLRHPLESNQIIERIELANRALSCSAVRHPAQAESDVVNPLTGARLSGNDTCVVLAPNAVEAEIFSTALLAMGREQADGYLEQRNCSGLQVQWF
jgi:thiamine biosynthesis lipoprotein